MEKEDLLWYDIRAMEKIRIYAREIWQIVNPLLIFFGVTAAVVSGFGILWMMFGSRLGFLYSHLEDVNLLLSSAAALWAAWILWKIDGREQVWYGELRRKLPGRAVFPCVGAAVGASMAGNCLLSLLRVTELSGTGQVETALRLGSPAVVVLSTCLAAPLAEEMVFRALIYRRLRRKTGPAASIAISALLFALYHGNLSQGLYALFVGAVLAVLMEMYGTVTAPLLAHVAANGLSVLLTWAGAGEFLSGGMVRRGAAVVIFGGLLCVSLRQAARDAGSSKN